MNDEEKIITMKAGQAGRESLKNITSNITTKIASNNPKRMFFRLILFS